MQKYLSFLLIVMAAAILPISCKKEVHSSIYSGGGKPAPLKTASVKSLPGAVQITYSLPDDDDILYVKATYETRPGTTREVKASYYSNNLIVEGFGDTLSHDVKLYVANRSDVLSEPIIVKVTPLTPPVAVTFRRLLISVDFGGLNIAYQNDTKADLAIYTLATDSTGKMAEVNVTYTTLPAGKYSLRGFDSSLRKFSFYIKDKFGNTSDTLTGFYKPLYEKALDKSLFKKIELPTDVKDDWGLPMENMWNGGYTDFWDMFHTQADPFPMWFTMDLGVKVQLSRMTLWQRQSPATDYAYNANNPKKFEIWGSNNPDPDGGWTNWVKLLDHEVIKPSGLPIGQVSQDDIDAAARGEEMTIPLTMPPVRYIRFKVLETFTNSAINIAEVSFWGQP